MIDKPIYYEESDRIQILEVGEGYVVVKRRYNFPKDKTTTQGDYPKLRKDNQCGYPKRLSCNYGDFFRRCEYMEKTQYGWTCTCQKNEKDNNKKKV